MSLPTVVEELLLEVAADGFIVYCCGPKTAPNALAACYEWDHYVDLITIRDFGRVTTARVPAASEVDIFAPEVVVWAYEGPPQQALRPCLTWCTQRIPTPPPPATRHQQACTFPAPSNAR